MSAQTAKVLVLCPRNSLQMKTDSDVANMYEGMSVLWMLWCYHCVCMQTVPRNLIDRSLLKTCWCSGCLILC